MHAGGHAYGPTQVHARGPLQLHAGGHAYTGQLKCMPEGHYNCTPEGQHASLRGHTAQRHTSPRGLDHTPPGHEAHRLPSPIAERLATTGQPIGIPIGASVTEQQRLTARRIRFGDVRQRPRRRRRNGHASPTAGDFRRASGGP
eukprot:scaffold50415_cov62-Phaeocystis_antarctica.AAC.2